MTLSIITITYNNLDGLKKTYESLQAQDIQEYEWIIVDGGSQDENVSFLETTHANWTSEPDKGIYDAMNKGMDRATGDYLLFLNAGDGLANPHTLEIILDSLAHSPDFLYGDSLEQDLKGVIHSKKAKPYITIGKGLFTHHQAMIYKVTELRYDLSYSIASDYDFTYRYLRDALAHDQNIRYIPEPLCVFEGGGVSQTAAKTGRLEQYYIRRHHHIAGAHRLYLMHMLSWTVRRVCPSLFWFLKVG